MPAPAPTFSFDPPPPGPLKVWLPASTVPPWRCWPALPLPLWLLLLLLPLLLEGPEGGLRSTAVISAVITGGLGSWAGCICKACQASTGVVSFDGRGRINGTRAAPTTCIPSVCMQGMVCVCVCARVCSLTSF